jgi:amino acid permease
MMMRQSIVAASPSHTPHSVQAAARTHTEANLNALAAMTEVATTGDSSSSSSSPSNAAPTTSGSGADDGHPIEFVARDAAENVSRVQNDDDDDMRIGTISSARFNILSTMVGGGCLSLPLAFQQSGNALVGPLMLLLTAAVTDFCFRLLVASAVHLHPPHMVRPGKDTFESITSVAFGAKAYVFSMGLVVLMCFFGAVGYSVLLRDMMEPINHAIAPHQTSPWLHKNFTMFLVILLVTPFCTLRHLTALKDCGAASMTSVLILGSCIVFRSVECNLSGGSGDGGDDAPWYTYLTFFPESWQELLNALPLYISCYVCHYNILPVHNELKDPTPKRVSWWLRSTLLFSTTIYMIMGFAGSAYAKCAPGHRLSGNVLLSFPENDPLLLVGRMCLAVTITLAFPMLVIPARDILLRSLILPRMTTTRAVAQQQLGSGSVSAVNDGNDDPSDLRQLQEPLLTEEEHEQAPTISSTHEITVATAPVWVLLTVSVIIFWSAGALASSVSSIDIVWDLLGSSLSILLSYLIPAGTYLVIIKMQTSDIEEGEQPQPFTRRQYWSRILSWLLLCVFFPLMIISTTNAVINTFFE